MRSIALKILFVCLLGICLIPDSFAQEDNTKTAALEYQVKKTSHPKTALHQWLINQMITWQPVGRSYIKAAIETEEEGRKRYEEIADAMIKVVYDPKEKPLFRGKYGRAKTLALIASMSYFESGYRKDVDFGIGASGRGDQGRSWCLMQILLGNPRYKSDHSRDRVELTEDYYVLHKNEMDTSVGFGGEDLISDRQACYRVGLHLTRRSFHACRHHPVEDRLGVYGSGQCIRDWAPSRIRVKKAQDWLAAGKPPLTDDEAMELLYPKDKDRSDIHFSFEDSSDADA